MTTVHRGQPVSTDSAWTPVIVDPEHSALWKTTVQSVFVLQDMLETHRFPASQSDVRATMTVEIEICVSMATVSTLVWCKTHVVDLPNATPPATKQCVDVFLATRVILS